jgi:hypothetical protein
MGQPLVQSPESYPGTLKDLDLASIPVQFKRHGAYCANIGRITFSVSDL